jgi:hypothetical protein
MVNKLSLGLIIPLYIILWDLNYFKIDFYFKIIYMMDTCLICKETKNSYKNMFTFTTLSNYFKSNENSCKEFINDKNIKEINNEYKSNKCIKICGDCFDDENERIYDLAKKE